MEISELAEQYGFRKKHEDHFYQTLINDQRVWNENSYEIYRILRKNNLTKSNLRTPALFDSFVKRFEVVFESEASSPQVNETLLFNCARIHKFLLDSFEEKDLGNECLESLLALILNVCEKIKTKGLKSIAIRDEILDCLRKSVISFNLGENRFKEYNKQIFSIIAPDGRRIVNESCMEIYRHFSKYKNKASTEELDSFTNLLAYSSIHQKHIQQFKNRDATYQLEAINSNQDVESDYNLAISNRNKTKIKEENADYYMRTPSFEESIENKKKTKLFEEVFIRRTIESNYEKVMIKNQKLDKKEIFYLINVLNERKIMASTLMTSHWSRFFYMQCILSIFIKRPRMLEHLNDETKEEVFMKLQSIIEDKNLSAYLNESNVELIKLFKIKVKYPEEIVGNITKTINLYNSSKNTTNEEFAAKPFEETIITIKKNTKISCFKIITQLVLFCPRLRKKPHIFEFITKQGNSDKAFKEIEEDFLILDESIDQASLVRILDLAKNPESKSKELQLANRIKVNSAREKNKELFNNIEIIEKLAELIKKTTVELDVKVILLEAIENCIVLQNINFDLFKPLLLEILSANTYNKLKIVIFGILKKIKQKDLEKVKEILNILCSQDKLSMIDINFDFFIELIDLLNDNIDFLDLTAVGTIVNAMYYLRIDQFSDGDETNRTFWRALEMIRFIFQRPNTNASILSEDVLIKIVDIVKKMTTSVMTLRKLSDIFLMLTESELINKLKTNDLKHLVDKTLDLSGKADYKTKLNFEMSYVVLLKKLISLRDSALMTDDSVTHKDINFFYKQLPNFFKYSQSFVKERNLQNEINETIIKLVESKMNNFNELDFLTLMEFCHSLAYIYECTSDEKIKNWILDLAKHFEIKKYKAKNKEDISRYDLDESTLSFFESLIIRNPELKQRIFDILVVVIMNGRKVSNRIVEIAVNMLYESKDLVFYENFYLSDILEKIDQNQYLEDSSFHIIEIERANKNLIMIKDNDSLNLAVINFISSKFNDVNFRFSKNTIYYLGILLDIIKQDGEKGFDKFFAKNLQNIIVSLLKLIYDYICIFQIEDTDEVLRLDLTDYDPYGDLGLIKIFKLMSDKNLILPAVCLEILKNQFKDKSRVISSDFFDLLVSMLLNNKINSNHFEVFELMFSFLSHGQETERKNGYSIVKFINFLLEYYKEIYQIQNKEMTFGNKFEHSIVETLFLCIQSSDQQIQEEAANGFKHIYLKNRKYINPSRLEEYSKKISNISNIFLKNKNISSILGLIQLDEKNKRDLERIKQEENVKNLLRYLGKSARIENIFVRKHLIEKFEEILKAIDKTISDFQGVCDLISLEMNKYVEFINEDLLILYCEKCFFQYPFEICNFEEEDPELELIKNVINYWNEAKKDFPTKLWPLFNQSYENPVLNKYVVQIRNILQNNLETKYKEEKMTEKKIDFNIKWNAGLYFNENRLEHFEIIQVKEKIFSINLQNNKEQNFNLNCLQLLKKMLKNGDIEKNDAEIHNFLFQSFDSTKEVLTLFKELISILGVLKELKTNFDKENIDKFICIVLGKNMKHDENSHVLINLLKSLIKRYSNPSEFKQQIIENETLKYFLRNERSIELRHCAIKLVFTIEDDVDFIATKLFNDAFKIDGFDKFLSKELLYVFTLLLIGDKKDKDLFNFLIEKYQLGENANIQKNLPSLILFNDIESKSKLDNKFLNDFKKDTKYEFKNALSLYFSFSQLDKSILNTIQIEHMLFICTISSLGNFSLNYEEIVENWIRKVIQKLYSESSLSEVKEIASYIMWKSQDNYLGPKFAELLFRKLDENTKIEIEELISIFRFIKTTKLSQSDLEPYFNNECLSLSNLEKFYINNKLSKTSRINSVMIDRLFQLGWRYDTLDELLDLELDQKPTLTSTLNRISILEMLVNLNIKFNLDEHKENKRLLKSNSDYSQVVLRYEKMLKNHFNRKTLKSQKDTETFFKDFEKDKFSNEEEQITAKDFIQKVLVKKEEFSEIKKDSLKKSVNTLIKKCDNKLSEDFYLKFLALFCVIFEKMKKYSLTLTQLTACYEMLRKPENKGILLQIKTGEGKSTIICILATYNALNGKFVDIITSNLHLAQEGVKIFKEIYDLFDLSVSCVTDQNKHKCYDCNIIYSDISSLEFDFLAREFEKKQIRLNRKFDNNILIIDEADSFFVDDFANVARISSEVPGIDLLEDYFNLIWIFLECNYSQIFAEKDMEKVKEMTSLDSVEEKASVQDLKDELKKRLEEKLKNFELENPNFFKPLPKFLEEYKTMQKDKWITNAIEVVFHYQEDVQFTIERNNENIHRIVPVDFRNTGVQQYSTMWDDAIHPFLQIKYNLRTTSEQLCTNFISNFGYIKKYIQNNCNRVYALSGTIGTRRTQEIIKNIYNCNSLIVPSSKTENKIEYVDKLCHNIDDWLETIYQTCMIETKRQRGIILVCETIKSAEKIFQYLRTSGIDSRKVMKFVKNNEIETIKIKAGQILIGTTLIGRGVDMNMDDVVRESGGIHLVVTFLPSNSRVEEQVKGRTCRQSKPGSTEIILDREASFIIELFNKLKSVLSDPPINLNISQDLSICQQLKEVRNYFSDKELEIIEEQTKLLELKDKKFEKFLEFREACRKKLEKSQNTKTFSSKINLLGKKIIDRTKEAIVGKGTVLSQEKINEICIKSIEERWGFFLKKLDQKIDEEKLKNSNILVQTKNIESLINQNYTEFEKKITEELSDINQLIVNQFYWIHIINNQSNFVFTSTSELEKIENLLKSLIEKEKDLSSSVHERLAHVKLAKHYLEGEEQSDKTNQTKTEPKYNKMVECKNHALEDLRKAYDIVTHEKNILEKFYQIYKLFNDSSSYQNEFLEKLIQKRNILKTHSESIENEYRVVLNSLRLVDVETRENNSIYVDRILNTEINQLENHSKIARADAVNLRLKNYKSYQDLRFTDDEAEQILSMLVKNNCIGKDIYIECHSFDQERFDKLERFLVKKHNVSFTIERVQLLSAEKIKFQDLVDFKNILKDGEKLAVELVYKRLLLSLEENEEPRKNLEQEVKKLTGFNFKIIRNKISKVEYQNLENIQEENAFLVDASDLVKIEALLDFDEFNLKNIFFRCVSVDFLKKLFSRFTDLKCDIKFKINECKLELASDMIKRLRKVISNDNDISIVLDYYPSTQLEMFKDACRRIHEYLFDENRIDNYNIFVDVDKSKPLENCTPNPTSYELKEFDRLKLRGIHIFYVLKERGPRQWKSIVVICSLATMSILLGIGLIAASFIPFLAPFTVPLIITGSMFILRGFFDLTMAYKTYKTNQINWSRYIKLKGIQLACTILTVVGFNVFPTLILSHLAAVAEISSHSLSSFIDFFLLVPTSIQTFYTIKNSNLNLGLDFMKKLNNQHKERQKEVIVNRNASSSDEFRVGKKAFIKYETKLKRIETIIFDCLSKTVENRMRDNFDSRASDLGAQFDENQKHNSQEKFQNFIDTIDREVEQKLEDFINDKKHWLAKELKGAFDIYYTNKDDHDNSKYIQKLSAIFSDSDAVTRHFESIVDDIREKFNSMNPEFSSIRSLNVEETISFANFKEQITKKIAKKIIQVTKDENKNYLEANRNVIDSVLFELVYKTFIEEEKIDQD